MCAGPDAGFLKKTVSNADDDGRSHLDEIRLKMQLLQRRGVDVEAVRGGMCIEPFTGVHRWDLHFAHKPGRQGSCDAVGVCTARFNSFGPSQARFACSELTMDEVHLYFEWMALTALTCP